MARLEYQKIGVPVEEVGKKIKELKDDTAAIEKIARDKYDMHLDNEDIFIIE